MFLIEPNDCVLALSCFASSCQDVILIKRQFRLNRLLHLCFDFFRRNGFSGFVVLALGRPKRSCTPIFDQIDAMLTLPSLTVLLKRSGLPKFTKKPKTKGLKVIFVVRMHIKSKRHSEY